MRTSKSVLTSLIFGVVLLAPLAATRAYAASPSELHIKPDGKFLATNVVVTQKAGTSNFFSRVTWGNNVYVRVTILAKKDTAITKAHGEPASVNEIKEKDVLDVEGTLSSGEGVLIINATRIRDTSLQIESNTVSGTVVSVSPESSLFALANTKFGGTTTVLLATSTLIQKGVRTIGLGEISKGDKILSATGNYDYSKNIFSASLIEVYQDKSMFVLRNFEGKLKSVSATTLPTTLAVSVGGTDYTVYLAEGASVLNNRRWSASLTRFVAGDTVRFYGGIRQTNFSEIDATVLRDLNF
ncbi:MAG: hypothetical protein Q7S01_00265 [bacterium]|nr:hypothetical protein [bacterium]